VDSLFGVSLNSIMFGLLLLVAVSFLVLGWIAWRQPLLVRMGLRNIRRRPSQTILIVVGLMLSTLIVSAAFATGDTVGYSITSSLYDQLEEVDFLIVFDENKAVDRPDDFTEGAFFEKFRTAFANDPEIDGMTGSVFRQLPVLNLAQRLSEPATLVVGVDPATVDTFKGLRTLDGELISAATLTGSNAYITERLADEIEALPGDTVTAFFEETPLEFMVLDVIRDSSITNQGNTLAGGMAINIETARTLFDDPNGLDNIAVSALGGTRGTLELSDGVQDRLENYLEGRPESGAEVAFTKKEFIELGELIGSVFITIFLVFGLFSISAGIMLIFLIFVMLAAERRSEMGMARAVGMNRLHLTQTFIAEGMAYNIGSALVGAILGLGVAWLLIFVLKSIAEQQGFDMAFHVNPQGFVIAYAAGVVVTFATVAFSSWRSANLNIVRAIRDLPEPQAFRSRTPSWRELGLGSVSALWTVGWITIFGLIAVALFQAFIFSLGFYGLPYLAVIPIGLLFSYGMALAGRGIKGIHGARRWLLFALWVLLLLPLSLPTWGLLRTKSWADRHRSGGGWAIVMLVIGAILVYLGGWVWGEAFPYTAGTTLAIIALAMLAVYWSAIPKTVFSLAGLTLVWYWLLPLPFSLIWEGGKGWSDPLAGLLGLVGLGPDEITGNIEMFFVSGISITASATLVIIYNSAFFLGLVTRSGRIFGGAVPAIRTAVAYPLAAQFRTGLTLAMFGLVVFSLVVMAFINYNFGQLFLGDEASAGFDVIVDSNPSNRIDDLRVTLVEAGYDVDSNVEGVGKLIGNFVQFRQDGVTEFDANLPLRGGDSEFFELANLPLLTRAIGYDTDDAVMHSIQNDPTAVIASADILQTTDGFGNGPDELFSIDQTVADLKDSPWQSISISVRDTITGEQRQFNLIAIIKPQATAVLIDDLSGVFGNIEAVGKLADGRFSDTFFLTTTDGSKGSENKVAKDIESTLLERGVQARSIEDVIDSQASQSQGFQILFEGFMGLGLIVGIAALGVIAFRTVVERRQQIGMLRAIGYSRQLVALSFFLESSFIALTGIGMGVVLGSALSYNLITSPEFTDGAELNFQFPWLRLAIIIAIAYVASALMTLIPARSASRIPVAEALRYE
jgi:ABC-type lipoprotein release transport system permease subunit